MPSASLKPFGRTPSFVWYRQSELKLEPSASLAQTTFPTRTLSFVWYKQSELKRDDREWMGAKLV